jgi:adenylate cyclase
MLMLKTTRWVLDPARATEDDRTLIAGYADQLIAAGVRLHRLSTSFRPLDPQIWVHNHRWCRGEVTVEERDREITPTHPVYLGSPAQAIHRGATKIRERLDPAQPTASRWHTLHEFARDGATDYLIYAIDAGRDGLRSYISYTTDRPGGFADEDLALLDEVHPAISMLIQLRAMHITCTSMLRTYLGPNAAMRVLDGQVQRGTGERITAAIWFCDLRDFTGLSDALPPAELLQLLDRYFEVVSGPVVDEGGEVLKFIGDAMLAIFPVGAAGPRDACSRAARAAMSALERFEAEVARSLAGHTLSFGISLHLGDVYYGNIGARRRLDFTVIGPAVNLAARVQGKCSELATPLLLTSAFVEQLEYATREVARVKLKGITTDVVVLTIAG